MVDYVLLGKAIGPAENTAQNGAICTLWTTVTSSIRHQSGLMLARFEAHKIRENDAQSKTTPKAILSEGKTHTIKAITTCTSY